MDQESNEKVLPELCASDAITVMRAYELQNQTFEAKQSHIGDLGILFSEIKDVGSSNPDVNPHLVNLAKHYYLNKVADKSLKLMDELSQRAHPNPSDYKSTGMFYRHDASFCLLDENTNELTVVMVFDPATEQRRPEGEKYIMPRAMVNAHVIREISGLEIGEIQTFGITSPVLSEDVSYLPCGAATPKRLLREVLLDKELEVYKEGVYFAGTEQIEQVAKQANMLARTFINEHVEPDIKPEFEDFKIDDPEFKKDFDAANEKMLSEYAANTLLLKALAKEIAEKQAEISSVPSKSEEAIIKQLKEDPEAKIDQDKLGRLDKIKSIDGPAYNAYAKYNLNSPDEIVERLNIDESNKESGNIISVNQLTHKVKTEGAELDGNKLKSALEDAGFDLDAFKNLTSSMQIRSRTKDFKGYKDILDKQTTEQIETIREAFPMLDAFINNEDGNDMETENAEDLGYGASPMGY